MRAIVMATGENAGFRLMSDRWPVGLMPLCGQPILQHIIEFLVQAGMSDFDFVLRHLADKVEAWFGNGNRWGVRFRYHLTPDGRPPHQRFPLIIGRDRGRVVLVREDIIPEFPPDWTGNDSTAVVFVDKNQVWTGWALIPAEIVSKVSVAGDADEFESRLLDVARSSGTISVVECPISFATAGDFLKSQGALLSGRGPQGSLGRWYEAAPGVRIGRNVSLHPAAQIEAPVYIGENCRIGPGARLGPNAVIGDNCIVDGRSQVSHSVVLPGSYVGELLELRHAVVDHNRLANVPLDAEISVTDNFLLAKLTETGLKRWLARTASRVLAIALLALLWPILLLVAVWLKLLRTGPVVHYRDVVELPADGAPPQWRTFRLAAFRRAAAGRRSLLLDILPGLVSVARGHLTLVGVDPRSPQEISMLPPDWRSLYLQSKGGLISEATVNGVTDADTDALYAAEAYYAAVAGFRHDLRLLASFVGQLLTGLPVVHCERTESEHSLWGTSAPFSVPVSPNASQRDCRIKD